MTSEPMAAQITRCAWRSVVLLLRRRLHLGHAHVGSSVALPDGRRYQVFRETSCDTAAGAPVMLAVWFRLRAIPAGAHVRRWLFERTCLVNTLLFAGCDGYLVKLWMVDPETSDYAGLYSWRSTDEAAAYGSYITRILRPWSAPGSVGFTVVSAVTLDEHLAGLTEARS